MFGMRAFFCCMLAATALAASSATAPARAEDFLVTDEATASSDTLWIKLFGTPEPDAYIGDASKADDYAAMLEMLKNDSIIDAMNGFSRLGKYREASRLTSYCAARLAYLRGDIRTARAGYSALGDFADAAYRVRLCDAMAAHRVYDGEKFGYADIDGNVVIEPAFDWAERVFRDESRAPESEGREDALLPVTVVFTGTTKIAEGEPLPDAGYYGLLRRDGTLAAPIKFDSVLWTKGGLAALQSGALIELINTITGERLGEGFSETGEYAEGYVPVRSGGKWGYIDANGEYLGDGLYWQNATAFSEGYAAVKLDGSYGYINLWGETVIEPRYEDARAFGEGLAAVRLKKRWGFINENGATVIEHEYADAGEFGSGVCPVKKNGKYGLINKAGEIILNNIYDEITPFDAVYHRAWIRINKLWGMVNPDGDVVIKPSWGTRTPLYANGLCRVSYRGAYGYMDAMGVTLIPNLYTKAAPFSAGRGGVVNAEGNVEYLDRFSRGFIVDGDVPTETLMGFIEGRKVIRETATDAETGEQTVISEGFALRLYEADGSPITNWAYSPVIASQYPAL